MLAFDRNTNNKPFFKYCKTCPKVEFLHLESMENHIRLAEPERHKAKLLELLERGKGRKKVTFLAIAEDSQPVRGSNGPKSLCS